MIEKIKEFWKEDKVFWLSEAAVLLLGLSAVWPVGLNLA